MQCLEEILDLNIYAVYMHLIGENLGFVHFGIGSLDPVKKKLF